MHIQSDVNDNDSLDFFDQYFLQQAKEASQGKNPGASGDIEVQSMNVQFQERLESNPTLALEQIRTGFRKWVLRYLFNCGSEQSYKFHTGRFNSIYISIKDAYNTVSAKQQKANKSN